MSNSNLGSSNRLNNNASYRLLNFFGFLSCISALVFAVVYLQGQLGIEPCPLCTLVRIIVIVQGIFFLIAFLHNPKLIGQRLYALLGMTTTITGIAISARHIWLQSLPTDEAPSCGPGFDYLISSMPLQDALKIIFQDSGACADVQWQFLGLTLPQLTLAFFVLVGVVLVIQFKKRQRRSNYFS